MSQWTVERNPAWAGRKPEGLRESACHDHSHYVQIVCGCGEHMHMHESHIRGVLTGIASLCHGCGDLLFFQPGELQAIFARMRKEGWIV